MALLLHQLIQDNLPVKRRQTPKGWVVFNAPCCHHRGHNQDTRSRGNLLFAADGSIVVNCYNCGFKTKYSGGDIGHNFETWMGYLGIPRHKIQEAKLEILSKKLSGEIEHAEIPEFFKPDAFPDVELPKHARPISDALTMEDPPDDLLECMEYLAGRGRAVVSGWNYHWSPSTKWDMNKRIIIPFYHHGRIVGWTGRYAGTPPTGVPKYFNSDLPGGYLFNADVIGRPRRKYVLIAEGPFDAIALDCVAALGSELNRNQIAWLNSTDQEKIVVPDRQPKNQGLIDIAIEQGWSVSFPDWEPKIKDAADASMRYGRLYALDSVLKSRTKSQLQIGYKRQLMKG